MRNRQARESRAVAAFSPAGHAGLGRLADQPPAAGPLPVAALGKGDVRLENDRLGRLVAPVKTHPGNEKLAAHLQRHLSEWFTLPVVSRHRGDQLASRAGPAPGERQPEGVGRQRTEREAWAQAVLMSVLQTAHQQGLCLLAYLNQTLRGTPPPLLAEPAWGK